MTIECLNLLKEMTSFGDETVIGLKSRNIVQNDLSERFKEVYVKLNNERLETAASVSISKHLEKQSIYIKN